MIKKSIKFILLLSIVLILVSTVNAEETTNHEISSSDSSSVTKNSEDSLKTSTTLNQITKSTTKSTNLKNNTKINSTKTSFQKVIYVSKNGKDSNIGNKTNPKKTIKNAILNLKNKGIIYILEGTFNEHNLIINKSMTLVGMGTTKTIINAKNKGRIFSISPKVTVSIKNIQLKNGKVSNANGGSIFSNKSNLSLYKIKIINTRSFSSKPSKNGCAGAIMAHGGKLKINNCEIVNSKSSSNGGAICAWNVTFNMRNTILRNNVALDNSYGYGGAIAIDKYSKVTINSCNFINNTASSGGVVSLFRRNSYLKMSGCSFVMNSAKRGSVLYKGSNAKLSTVNLDYNWWNTLKPSWNSLIKDYNNKYKHPSSWIMMKFTSNKKYFKSAINKSVNCTLTANFNYYRTFNSSKLKNYNSTPIKNLKVIFSFSDNTILSKKIVNSISKVRYTHVSTVKNSIIASVKIYNILINSLKLQYDIV